MSKPKKAKELATPQSDGLPLEGSMNYLIILGKDDLDVSYEQSNENNLVAFIAVQDVYEGLWKQQMEPNSPDRKMNKDEMKELQVARNFLKKHIAMLGAFVQEKYKNARPEKPIIETVNPLDAMKEINKHKAKKKKDG